LYLIWFVCALTLCYSLTQDSLRFSIAIYASFSCFGAGLVFWSVGYQPYSLVTVATIMFIVSYPFAGIANLFLDTPAVVSRFWPETDKSMLACGVGLTAFALGSYFSKFTLSRNLLIRKNHCFFIPRPLPTSRYFNCLLFSPYLIAVVIKFFLNIYYHSSISFYDVSFSKFMNLLEIITWVGLTGIFLQLYRFLFTRRGLDLALFFFLLAIAVLIYVPSGSRMQAIGMLPPLIGVYLIWEKGFIRKFFITLLAIAGMFIFIGVLGIYRVLSVSTEASLLEKVQQLISVTADFFARSSESGNDTHEKLSIIVHRVSDFIATGRVISHTPDVFPFRGFGDMVDWWQIAVPGVFRPSNNPLNFNEGTIQTLKYGVSDGPWTSTPIMILSDFFSRGGWPALMLGMLLLGVAYRKLDAFVAGKNDLFRIVFFFLFMRFAWQFYVSSLLLTVTSLVRETVVIYILSRLIGYLGNKSTKRRELWSIPK